MLAEVAGWPKDRWPSRSPRPTATRRSSTRTPTPSTLPESFKKSVPRLQDGGWDEDRHSPRSSADCRCPARCSWALHEHVLGANPARPHVLAAAPAFAQILYNNGTEEQKKWAALHAERGWGATMVLTEPDAGSDVGAGRTKAVKQADGSWHIEGVKRFITSGDADDLFENILHLVLAAARGRRPRHQGTVAVLRAEVPLRPRDRRARRTQRRLRHQRRAQDGPEGLGHLRAHLRPARRPGQGLAGRRGAQRHRADVRRHRARPHDGGHQGHRARCRPATSTRSTTPRAASRAPT